MERRILVVDYDNCALTLSKTKKDKFLQAAPEHLLSPPLVKFACENGYQGFYGCTHRCYMNDGANIKFKVENIEKIKATIRASSVELLQSLKEKYKELVDYSQTNMDDLFASMITKNFSQASGLSCFAVSTPDDLNGACGSGYKNILEPYEKALLKTKRVVKSKENVTTPYNFDIKFKSKYSHVQEYDDKSKNAQYIQIAQDIAKRYPHDIIILDIVDDQIDIIKNVLDMSPIHFPSNIILNIHHYDARLATEDTEIICLGSIKGLAESPAIEFRTKHSNLLFSTHDQPQQFDKISGHINTVLSQIDEGSIAEKQRFANDLKKYFNALSYSLEAIENVLSPDHIIVQTQGRCCFTKTIFEFDQEKFAEAYKCSSEKKSLNEVLR